MFNDILCLNLDNRHSGITGISQTGSVPVSSLSPTDDIELPVSIYDVLQSTTYQRGVHVDMSHSNPDASTPEPPELPSIYDRVTDRHIRTYENTDLPVTTHNVQSTSFAEVGMKHLGPSSVERPLSSHESSTVDLTTPLPVRIPVPERTELPDIPATTNGNPQSINHARITMEMPYSRLESTSREPPRPPAVYERMTTRIHLELIPSSDSVSEHNYDDDDYDDVGHY